MAAGLIGLVPLTGVVTPFLSFGGSAMVANFAALGLLAAIRRTDRPAADLEAVPSTDSAGSAARSRLPARCIVVGMLRVQVVRADDVLVKPHLGVQADGTRRFQYNPRVLDAARRIPRGTIFDRNGLPARHRRSEALLDKAAPVYQRLGRLARVRLPES